MYVVDESNRLQKFDENGKFLWARPTGTSGSYGVAATSQHVYVSDWVSDRILKLDPNGDFVGMWGSEGTLPGQLRSPIGLGIDHTGHVWVADSGNSRVQEFDADGRFLRVVGWGSFGEAFDVATGPAGEIYVADPGWSWGGGGISRFLPDGTPDTKWSTPGQPNFSVGLDAAGGIYVAAGYSVRVFDAQGTVLATVDTGVVSGYTALALRSVTRCTSAITQPTAFRSSPYRPTGGMATETASWTRSTTAFQLRTQTKPTATRTGKATGVMLMTTTTAWPMRAITAPTWETRNR